MKKKRVSDERQMVWSEYGFVIVSGYRSKVVLSLYKHPKTPAQISAETGLAMAHVSRVLRELTERDITRCLTPNVLKGKVYDLTEKGKSVAKIMAEDQKGMSIEPK
jgi:predicted transcriptional regulator